MFTLGRVSLFISIISGLLLGIYYFKSKADLLDLENLYKVNRGHLMDLNQFKSNVFINSIKDKKNLSVEGEFCSERIREISFNFLPNKQFILTKRNEVLKGRYEMNQDGEVEIFSDAELETNTLKPFMAESNIRIKGKQKVTYLYISNLILSRFYCRGH